MRLAGGDPIALSTTTSTLSSPTSAFSDALDRLRIGIERSRCGRCWMALSTELLPLLR